MDFDRETKIDFSFKFQGLKSILTLKDQHHF